MFALMIPVLLLPKNYAQDSAIRGFIASCSKNGVFVTPFSNGAYIGSYTTKYNKISDIRW